MVEERGALAGKLDLARELAEVLEEPGNIRRWRAAARSHSEVLLRQVLALTLEADAAGAIATSKAQYFEATLKRLENGGSVP